MLNAALNQFWLWRSTFVSSLLEVITFESNIVIVHGDNLPTK